MRSEDRVESITLGWGLLVLAGIEWRPLPKSAMSINIAVVTRAALSLAAGCYMIGIIVFVPYSLTATTGRHCLLHSAVASGNQFQNPTVSALGEIPTIHLTAIKNRNEPLVRRSFPNSTVNGANLRKDLIDGCTENDENTYLEDPSLSFPAA